MNASSLMKINTAKKKNFPLLNSNNFKPLRNGFLSNETSFRCTSSTNSDTVHVFLTFRFRYASMKLCQYTALHLTFFTAAFTYSIYTLKFKTIEDLNIH